MKNLFLLLLLFFYFPVSACAQNINTEKSIVNFKIGNMGFSSVKGSFIGMKGEVNFTPANLGSSNIDVCIEAKTVQTKSAKRDNHLRNEDFFEVDKYPNICFQSVSIERKNEGYLVKGKLTMHGVTKPVAIPFSVSNKVFIGQIEINRLDYNVGDTGTFLVSDEVELSITCYLK